MEQEFPRATELALRRGVARALGRMASPWSRRLGPSPRRLMSRLSRRGWLALTAAAVAGCGSGASDSGGRDEVPPAASVGPSGVRLDTVDVALLEYVIGMPMRLAAGRVAWRLSNQGFEIHNLKVIAEGGDAPVWETERDVIPGETRVVELELAPGSYTVLCDVAGHDEKGMQMKLVVTRGPER